MSAVRATCTRDGNGRGSRRGIVARIGCVAAFALVAPSYASPPAAVAPATRQLVVVVTRGWRDREGALARFARAPGGGFAQVGEPLRVAVGAAGLGWGLGVFPGLGAPPPGPLKREGDRRSPAGVFALTEATGYDAAPPDLRFPYRVAGPGLRCVDDPRSPAYNRLVEEGEAPFASAEHMRRDDGLYVRTVVVGHNPSPAVAGAGSCVFLHVGRPDAPTLGCTAMPRPALEALLAWLDADAAPLLVMLPRQEYAARAVALGLPPLSAGARAGARRPR